MITCVYNVYHLKQQIIRFRYGDDTTPIDTYCGIQNHVEWTYMYDIFSPINDEVLMLTE